MADSITLTKILRLAVLVSLLVAVALELQIMPPALSVQAAMKEVDTIGTGDADGASSSLGIPPRQTPNFSKPFYSLKPVTGRRKVLVILWDPHRPDHPAPSKRTVENLIFGPKPSVNDYFRENSGGLFYLEKAGVLGWFDADHPYQLYWREPPFNPESWIGTAHYLIDENGNERYIDDEGFLGGHSHKWAESIWQADRHGFNFKSYDTNNNGTLAPDELAILMVIPQNDPFGTQRPVVARHIPQKEPLIVDGVKIDSIVEAYIGSPPSLGLVAHELAHILLGTGDMYFTFFYPYAAGAYSIMDWSPHSPPHLDPFHKLKLGWLEPRIVTKTGWYTIRDVERYREAYILYDPTRGDDEYFILENRWPGQSYDRTLPDSGLAIWHIIEDSNVFGNLPAPAGVNASDWSGVRPGDWARRAIRMIRPTYGPPRDDRKALWDAFELQTGNYVSLRWIDGTSSGFAIQYVPTSSPGMMVRIKTPIAQPAPNSALWPFALE